MLIRKLGNSQLSVSALGLGCMGFSKTYGDIADEESTKTLHYAIDHGINFLDTADVYGVGHNETLLANALKDGYRNKTILASKCGMIREITSDGSYRLNVNGKPEYIKSACEASLTRLKTDVIDLYYLHRADRHVPIEESVGALKDLVQAGKVRYIGLSEVTSQTLKKAHQVHPITALQSEYSLWCREPEQEILSTCRVLGVGFVPFSPLGRGFLTGDVRSMRALPQSDLRHILPKLQGENFEKNLKIADTIVELAAKKECTPGQFLLAWLLAQGHDIVPIPGTRKIERIKENIGSVKIEFSQKELDEINKLIPINASAGARYPEYLDFEV